MDNFFQCHKHMLQKSYRLGKPWRSLHNLPLSSDGHLSFEFCWQTIHKYFNVLDQIPTGPHPIKECEGVVSIPVDRFEFLNNDSYAQKLVDSLVSNSNSKVRDFEADWIVSMARIFLQVNPHRGTMLIELQVVRNHFCFESRLVRGVMERSFEEMNLKPASKLSFELLKSVDFDEAAFIDEEHNCVDMEIAYSSEMSQFHLEGLRQSLFIVGSRKPKSVARIACATARLWRIGMGGVVGSCAERAG
nr:RING finger protein 148-like [Ipomoea trifida]